MPTISDRNGKGGVRGGTSFAVRAMFRRGFDTRLAAYFGTRREARWTEPPRKSWHPPLSRGTLAP